MRKIIYISFFLCCFFPLKSQISIDWKSMGDVTWKREYVKALAGYYDVPRFGASVEALDNKEITIKGFYIPIDMEGTIFALSKSPSSSCFFCGVGGIQTVMEIFIDKGYKGLRRVRTDRFVELKGTFIINRDDPEHLMYLLKNAELIRVIK